jgi:hypothetical protein
MSRKPQSNPVRRRTDPKTVQTLLRHSDVKLTGQFHSEAVSQDRLAAPGEMLTAILSYESLSLSRRELQDFPNQAVSQLAALGGGSGI